MQVKRDGDICIVKARVTPEHSVRKKAYAVKLECNEKDETRLKLTKLAFKLVIYTKSIEK